MAVWRRGYGYLHPGTGHDCLSCGVCAIAAFSDDDMNDLLPLDGVERFVIYIATLDIHPLAIQMVRNLVSKKKLMNVMTIHSDCKTGLPDKSLDVVLLYDAFHDLGKPDDVLKEIHRILRSNGILSFSDHHMKEEEIVSKVTKSGSFRLLRKGERTYSFSKGE